MTSRLVFNKRDLRWEETEDDGTLLRIISTDQLLALILKQLHHGELI